MTGNGEQKVTAEQEGVAGCGTEMTGTGEYVKGPLVDRDCQ